MEMLRIWGSIALGLSLVACAPKGSDVRDPLVREELCRTLSRNLVLEMPNEPGINKINTLERQRMLKRYERNRCKDFENEPRW